MPDSLSSPVDQIRALLDHLEGQVARFPTEYSEQAAPILHQIREQVQALAHPPQGEETAFQQAAAGPFSAGDYAHLRAVFDSTPEGLIVADEQGRVVMTNQAAERLRARSAPDGLEENSHAELRLYHPDGTLYDPRDLPLTRSALDGETCTDIEMFIEWPDGQRRPLLVNTAPISGAGGIRAGAVGVFQDIAHRKRLEEALRESEERYRQLVELYPDIVFVQSGGRFAFINQAGARMFGANSPAEILGRPVLDFIHPDDHQAVRERIHSLNDDRVPVPPREERFLRLDGSPFFVNAAAVPMDYDGQPSALVIARDISRQISLMQEQMHSATEIEIQRRLAEYRELERQEIARDLHDGPIQILASALFNIQVARDMVQDPAAQEEFAQVSKTMKNVVRELREVVNELRPPALIRFGLAKALNQYIDDFTEKYPHLQVILDVQDAENRLPEQANLALFRICQEALNNVARHAQATNIWLRFSPQPGQYLLEIEDNGMGFVLPEDFMEHAQSGHYGLVGMRERARSIGGKLWINTQPGAGTIIKIAVPATPPLSGWK